MSNNLVIVESPAKVKTIKKFLGKNYQVMASGGHVRDFPKSRFGIDVENDFEPQYITIRGKGDVLSQLRKAVSKSDKIYLATDPDREGEAISWHLANTLKLAPEKTKRITFNEITKTAVKNSLKNPREIDMNLVDAQQTRRMLDRIVGYRISPILWAKVKSGLSAGRVQSAALRIICDREDEIDKFVPDEYWTIDARLLCGKSKLEAAFYGGADGKIKLCNKEQADEVLGKLKGARYKVAEIKKTTRVRKSPQAYRTSTLQQDASRILGFSIQKTMRIAQQLYEGVSLKGNGTVGLITYLRTDSVRVSDDATAQAYEYICGKFGKEYAAAAAKNDSNKGANVQDAHEAIRPTDINREPDAVKESLSADQFKLYRLIWNRFAASRMTAAEFENTAVRIDAAGYRFNSSSVKTVFEGYRKVYAFEEDSEAAGKLPDKLETGMELSLDELYPQQHFTQPPAHFTEASLVRVLEELGIGRPSTYAPTVSTLLGRRYIVKEKKNLFVSELGNVVNGIMKSAFPNVVDVNFTANMESELDEIEEGKTDWKTPIRKYYPIIMKEVEAAEKDLEKVKIRDEESDVKCEKCGRMMVIKYGAYGKFLACPGFPECRNTKPFLEKIGVKCPKCGKDVIVRRTRKGRIYYGCEGYPECDFMSWQKPKAVL